MSKNMIIGSTHSFLSLKGESLQTLYEHYKIRCGYHPDLSNVPLVVLNYDNVLSPKEEPLVSECRGLVLELDTWKVVARGMTRFFNQKNQSKENNNHSQPQIKSASLFSSSSSDNVQSHSSSKDNDKDQTIPKEEEEKLGTLSVTGFNYSNYSLEVKEDGTYIQLFNYKGEWMLATRHNFCEDFCEGTSDTNRMTYRDLFISTCGGLDLNDVCKDLDTSYTYCIELCSPFNQVIQFYDQPVLYLLTVVNTQTGSELSIDQVDAICLKLRKRKELKNWKRPRRFSNFSNQEQAFEFMNNYLMNRTEPQEGQQNQMSVEQRMRVEGFVMRDQNNERLKLKNPYYLMLHKMKYRGWIQAEPKLLVPFVLFFEDYKFRSENMKDHATSKNGCELLSCSSSSGSKIESLSNHSNTSFIKIMKNFYECDFEMEQLQKRYHYCVTVLNKEFKQLVSVWKEIISEYEDIDVETPNNILEQTPQSLKSRTKLFPFIELLLSSRSDCQSHERDTLSIHALEQVMKNNGEMVLSQLFSSQQQLSAFRSAVLDYHKSHAPHYCIPNKKFKILNTGLAQKKPHLDKKTNQYKVQCFCGKPMILKRLKRDFVQYRWCHCGAAFDVMTYKVGTLLWMCSSYPQCLLNHMAHQMDEMFSDEQIQYVKGQPLGIPCSELCKILRLQIHEIMAILMKKNNWRKSQCYSLMASWLNVEKSQAHVALFSIETCLFVIQKFFDNYSGIY
ncbi:hypothetical protein FDP41_008565 [Naegleria fowleri]|uniref:T4 RNA ligase 1-like N-terminal domain-containing protein n=1 Tax=Naegleria fowleri TaxID=5763 RepID=A0A6A5BH47_NAEFO|nr:uncharacterized protein FDP41_008565 [Naegleria fowleri]KAF0973358.1 hypothetical protein FDP41_008565 [Naegleria fowleri]